MTKPEPMPERVPVLIVGGGPTGLLASILLGRLGVASLLVEKHRSTSRFPKARKLNTRTMEILRVVGLEPEVRAQSDDVSDIPLMLGGDTLAGPVRFRIEGEPYEASLAYSPTTWAFCPQDRLEPILRARAQDQPASDVRFGVEVTALTRDAHGVAVELREQTTGRRQSMRAEYVIAADGAHSLVRRLVGIETSGAEEPSAQLNVLFHADLESVRGPNRSVLYKVANHAVEGVIGMAGEGRWILLCAEFPDPSPQRCADLIRAAAGVADLDVEVEAVNRWQLAALVADRFRCGRIFLTGDAAHRLQPNGAFGLNTGVQDVHNLAWKLHGVLGGWAGEGLLDTYEAERRPVALANAELSRHFWDNGSGSAPGSVLGFNYETGALVPDGTDLPRVTDPVAEYAPTGRPGSRAPHWWLSGDGGRVSSLDLFDREFVLLTAGRGAGWWKAVADLAAAGTPLSVIQPLDPYWTALYDIGPDGAVLVRPDGHVAWRSRTAPTGAYAGALRSVLARVLCTQLPLPTPPPTALSPELG